MHDLPIILSNDDGTWRRIKIIDFPSKFIDQDKIELRDEIDENGNTVQVPANDLEFVKIADLTFMLKRLSPLFLSLLIKIYLETKGNVVDTDEVKLCVEEYRKSQNKVSLFINDAFTFDTTANIKKSEISSILKSWNETNSTDTKYKNVSPTEVFTELNKDARITLQGNTFFGLAKKEIEELYDDDGNVIGSTMVNVSNEELFLQVFHDKCEITNNHKDFIPTTRLTEFCKSARLKIHGSKEINIVMLSHLHFDTKNKSQYKNKKIKGKSVISWVGIREKKTAGVEENQDQDL